MDDTEVIGRVGSLVVGTRGAAGAGEAVVAVRGGTEVFLAWSDEPLPAGVSVLVIGNRGPRAVDVVQWTDPVTGD